jgi:hypothetical protein
LGPSGKGKAGDQIAGPGSPAFPRIVLVAFAALLITLAWAANADAETLLLRWFTAFWIAATATGLLGPVLAISYACRCQS